MQWCERIQEKDCNGIYTIFYAYNWKEKKSDRNENSVTPTFSWFGSIRNLNTVLLSYVSLY